MAESLTAWLRGDDTAEADAGALALADLIHEIRQSRLLIQALVKAFSK